MQSVDSFMDETREPLFWNYDTNLEPTRVDLDIVVSWKIELWSQFKLVYLATEMYSNK